jgi:GAF domain-containing protein
MAMEELNGLYRRYVGQEWRAYVQQEERIGYQKLLVGGKLLTDPIQTEEIRIALENGKILTLAPGEDRHEALMVVPVMLRGQAIGVLHVKAPSENRTWTQEEVNMVQAISDRLALALENAHLLETTQRRAATERTIGEIASRISGSVNLRNVLRTTVQELGRALPGSEIIIQFQSDQDQGPK